MRKKLEAFLNSSVEEYCCENSLNNIWGGVIVRFADAQNPGFEQLKSIVDPNHYVPEDFLSGAKTVVSWFIPIGKDIADGNLPGKSCSADWAKAYLDTNKMAVLLNDRLINFLNEQGYAAVAPLDAGMISFENPRSRWSQRHAAYLCGHGTFGINNMLISDAGTIGRYYSIVTDMEISPDPIPAEDRCLYKKSGACAMCVSRCMTGALQKDSFDRFKCLEQCMKNDALYPGADVCGKCVVSLPCSHKIP